MRPPGATRPATGAGMSGFDPHHHHEVEHSGFSPATYPTHAPVVEPGAQRNRCAKAEIFRFYLHVPATPSVHTFIPPCGRDSKSDGKAQEWGGGGYFTAPGRDTADPPVPRPQRSGGSAGAG